MDGCADKAQLSSVPIPAAGWAVGFGLTWLGLALTRPEVKRPGGSDKRVANDDGDGGGKYRHADRWRGR